MKFLIVLVLFPCLLFAQLMPKYFSNTHNFNSTTFTINNKFNEASTDKELDKIEASYLPNDNISKIKYEKKAYVDSSKKLYTAE